MEKQNDPPLDKWLLGWYETTPDKMNFDPCHYFPMFFCFCTTRNEKIVWMKKCWGGICESLEPAYWREIKI